MSTRRTRVKAAGHSESARIFSDVGAFCLRLVALRPMQKHPRPMANVSAISISDTHDLFMKKPEQPRAPVGEWQWPRETRNNAL